MPKGYAGFNILTNQDTSANFTSVVGGGYNSFTGTMNPIAVNQDSKPSLVLNIRLIKEAKNASFNAEEIVRNLAPILKAKESSPSPESKPTHKTR